VKLLQYLDAEGRFDYARYRNAQIAANHAKLGAWWVARPTIDFLARYVRAHIAEPRRGLCHGTRRGVEQQWFREALGEGVEVIGTEISDTASQFPHTVQHDFHEPLPGWEGNVDFVYSNSWDHAFDPARAFTTWVASLAPGGMVLLEHSAGHSPANTSESDPFGIEAEELVQFIDQVGAGLFLVAEVLDTFDFTPPTYYGTLRFLVVRAK
jgi:hypothetical protein